MMTLDSPSCHHTLAMTMEEGIAAAKLFEQAGCDSMHLRLGPLGHHVAQFGADLYFILNGIEGCTGFGTQYDFSKNWRGMLIGNTSGCGIGLNVCRQYKRRCLSPAAWSAATITRTRLRAGSGGRQGRLLPDDPPPDRGHGVRPTSSRKVALTRLPPAPAACTATSAATRPTHRWLTVVNTLTNA